MSTGTPAVSTANTLNKASSHLRWLVEKSGVDPERVVVCIIVDSHAERDKVIARFRDEFIPSTMTRVSGDADRVIANGVRITVTVREKA